MERLWVLLDMLDNSLEPTSLNAMVRRKPFTGPSMILVTGRKRISSLRAVRSLLPGYLICFRFFVHGDVLRKMPKSSAGVMNTQTIATVLNETILTCRI